MDKQFEGLLNCVQCKKINQNSSSCNDCNTVICQNCIQNLEENSVCPNCEKSDWISSNEVLRSIIDLVIKKEHNFSNILTQNNQGKVDNKSAENISNNSNDSSFELIDGNNNSSNLKNTINQQNSENEENNNNSNDNNDDDISSNELSEDEFKFLDQLTAEFQSAKSDFEVLSSMIANSEIGRESEIDSDFEHMQDKLTEKQQQILNSDTSTEFYNQFIERKNKEKTNKQESLQQRLQKEKPIFQKYKQDSDYFNSYFFERVRKFKAQWETELQKSKKERRNYYNQKPKEVQVILEAPKYSQKKVDYLKKVGALFDKDLERLAEIKKAREQVKKEKEMIKQLSAIKNKENDQKTLEKYIANIKANKQLKQKIRGGKKNK